METGNTTQPELSEKSSAPRSPKKQHGFLYQFGPQAWVDTVMSRRMIVGHAWPLVSYTLLPILRMTSDAEKIDREYDGIRSRREEVRFLDSPRERWRKYYGNFVREIEWALLELRNYFTQAEYEEIVVGTCVSLSKENSSRFIEMMKSMAGRELLKKTSASDAPKEPSRVQKLMFKMFNPAGFLTGPAEITEFGPAGGLTVMEVPDCAWFTCAAAESLPNPEALPEQGCLLICKGSFERLFSGEDGGLRMEFDPYLPETSCTVRMSWKAR